eukprot:c24056_g1_i1 orf=414-1844(-)
MADQTQVRSLAEKLSWEVRELSLGTSGEIERIRGAPTSLRFLRDFVLPNKPCIITHAIDHWPALAAWTNSYLRSALAIQQVSVHLTPDGFADALVDLHRISSVFGCTVVPPATCNPAETEASHPHASDPPLPSLNLHEDALQKASLDDAHNVHGASSFGRDNVTDDHARDNAQPLAVAHVKAHPAMTVSCNTRSSEQQLTCGEDVLAANASVDNRGIHDNTLPLDMNLLNTTSRNSSCSIKSREERLQQAWFVTAHVERVPFPTALDLILHSKIGRGIAYAQEQNGCFLSEYSALAADAETHLPWATEAFGSLPEAVNLWIGNEKAVTSFHKDHYENLYAVIAGEKHFTLLPPTDVHRLSIRKYPIAHYVKHKGGFSVEKEEPVKFVPWASVDPYPPSEVASEAESCFPEYFSGPRPFTCTLRAGEILYLPSMWFHHVRQSPDTEGRTIALNFWYDMQFDVKYAYFNFLESLILRL